MKAVAAALVLVVGAAVVLWYGNTLNSWVLGGLIGGLAALLLSIPISLTIFSFLSRHHDQRSRSREEYEPVYEYPEVPERVARSVYVVDEDRPRGRPEVWGEENEWYEDEREEEDFYDRTQSARRFPAQPRLPAPNQQRPVPRLPAPQPRTGNSTRQLSQTTRHLPERNMQNPRQSPPREKEITSRRPTQQRMNYTGHPGYQPETQQQSQMRSQALRMARLEAAQQREEDDIEELPSQRSRRSPGPRLSRALSEQQYDEQDVSQRVQPGAKQYPRRPRRIVDASQDDESQFLAQPGENTTRRPLQRQQTEPETDFLDPSMMNDNIKKPLIRKAPYMYEDDPLRQELSQQVEGPITRRSSRNLARHQEEDR